jgi:putative ABC transport system ATP-binding protein
MAKSDKNKVVEVKNLKKVFGEGRNKNKVLKDLSFTIYSGEFVVIFGPSGCGKTTLLNSIIGLEPPTSGEITIRGTKITSLAEDKRADFRARKFGIVYQMPYWVKSLNVVENVALPLTIAGSQEEHALNRAQKTLARVDLKKSHSKQIPTELSGGEQQRAGLARALVSWPWIVVADEPTGNLDVDSGKKIMDLLKKLSAEQKRTLILVTHNIDYLQYATRTLAMEDGKIVGDSREGGTEDIIEELSNKIEILRKEKQAFDKGGDE